MERLVVINKIKEKFKEVCYDVKRGPATHINEGSKLNLEQGSNCQLFAHEVIEAISGFQLPPVVLSKEIYECTGEVFDQTDLDDAHIGDVVLFGPVYSDEYDVRNLHVGVIIEDGINPVIIHFHGNGTEKGLRENRLSSFSNTNNRQDFRTLWGVRRLNPEKILDFNQDEFCSIGEIEAFWSTS